MFGRRRLKKPRPPDDLRALREFASFYSKLDKDSYLYKIVERGIGILKSDMCTGKKIGRKKFPKVYLKKYGISNLWKMDLDSAYRLMYTIVAENSRKILVVLEVLSHKGYVRRFGYGSD